MNDELRQELSKITPITEGDLDRLTKLYEQTIDLYKFYFNTILKINLFFYTGSATVFAFFIQKNTNTSILFLPWLLSFILACVFSLCIPLSQTFKGWFVSYICQIYSRITSHQSEFDDVLKSNGYELFFAKQERDGTYPNEEFNGYYHPSPLSMMILLGFSTLAATASFLFLASKMGELWLYISILIVLATFFLIRWQLPMLEKLIEKHT